MRAVLRVGLMFSVLVVDPAAAGTIVLTQDAFTVQQKVDFSWIYTVDESGMATGDQLRIYDPIFHGMRWSKWGDLSPWWDHCTPQSTTQAPSWGLVSVHARRGDVRVPDARVVVSRSNCTDEDMTCSSAVHDLAWTEVELVEGTLQEGDEVLVGIGDIGACEADCTDGACGICIDCGFEMPDRSFPEISWPSDLCPVEEDCAALEPAVLSVSSQSTPDTLVATVPSQAEVGAPFRLKVAVLDRWGNAVTQTTQTISVDAPNGMQTYTLTEDDGGWHDFEVVLDDPGVHRIEVMAGGLGTYTNPVEVMLEAPNEHIFWGDIHVHHGYTWTDEDGQTHDLNHDYGRDVAGLDIVSQSQKAKGIELGEKALWAELQDNCRSYTVRDEYLVLLSFEWMGDLVSLANGSPSEGHHNVYYDGCEAPLGTHDVTKIDSLGGEMGLWTWLEDVEVEHGVKGITVPHATRWTGYNFDVSNPGTQTLVEVYSEWGDNTTWTSGQLDADVPGSMQDLMNSGLRLGWIGGSDNHDGWMGNPLSQKRERSGLGAFIASSLSRKAVFDTLQRRHTYATTGHRPILRFRAEDGGHILEQGSEYLARDPTLRWRYHGTSAIERLRLFRIEIGPGAQQQLVKEWAGDGMDMVGSQDLGPTGAKSAAYWLEVRQWDGETAWSSPIWVTRDCDRRSAGAQDPYARCPDEDTGSRSPSVKGDSLRCSCSQGPATGWLWLGAMVLGLIRRSEERSPSPSRRSADQGPPRSCGS